MSDVIPFSGRRLSNSERAAFRSLGLSAGNWAALAAAPFYTRPDLRAPDLQQRGDALHLETLRRELRTASGLSEETGRFWKRLARGRTDGTELATQLLAWHLATDLPFAKRERVLGLFAAAAGAFANDRPPRGTDALVGDLRLLIDCALPCRSFSADAPRWVNVPIPPPEVLEAIARSCGAPVYSWPEVSPAQFPTLVGALGDPAEWWGKPHPGRRAVERGAAVFSFSERERLYADAAGEWQRASERTGTDSEASARSFVSGIREWVEAARKAARLNVPAKEEAPGPRTVPTAGVPPSPTSAVEFRSVATGKTLRVGDGMRVGRAEYRDVFGLPDAGLAAADQFELTLDPARGAWVVRTVAGAGRPTWFQGAEVGAEGQELIADGVVSVGGKLELVARFV